jgi:hypothetical protein
MLQDLYWRKRLSIRQTASATGMSYETTRRKLRRTGKLRTQSEGQMRHSRHAFSRNGMERAYLIGLRAGDINAWRKTVNTIEVRVSTTRPAMAKLFSDSFGKYGHIMADAGRAYLPGRYRWQVRAHLDNTFRFLLSKTSDLPKERNGFYAFLGGYSDAECCWSVYFSKGRVKMSWSIESRDLLLLRSISDRLRSEGFHPLHYIYKERENQKFRKDQKIQAPEDKQSAEIRLVRKHEVLNLAEKLLRISRHEEKLAKMRLILGIHSMTRREIVAALKGMRRKIRTEGRTFEAAAKREYKKGKAATLAKGSSASLV